MSSSSGRRNVPAAPPRSTACGGSAPACVEQLGERRAELALVQARPRDVARDAEEPRVAVVPPSKMCGTLTSVSTLLTTVGLPNSPTSTGNGGLLRGSPR